MSAAYVLEVRELCKAFGVTQANDHVSLAIRPGELRVLAGENGSGKSTLISQIVGITKADSGEIFLNGAAFAPKSPVDAFKAGIGFVVQELGLIDDFNAGMNMFLGNEERFRRFGFLATGKMNAEAKKELARWGFKGVPMHTKAVNLSIEKRKMIEITKALSLNPRLLILDETTQSLSHDTKKRLYEIIREKQQEGVAILMITHDVEEMCQLADSVTVLRDGALVATLEGEEISAGKIKSLMVGREVQADYYRPDAAAVYDDEVVLRAENISFPGRYADVSFELHRGEILGFCGLSDAGIHEIGKAVFGLEPPQQGTIELPHTGRKIRKPLDATRNKIAYVPKDRDSEALLMDAPIRDNVYMPSCRELEGKAFFINPRRCTALARQAKERFSIKCTSVNQIVSSLSGGNKQKVNLGRWLIKDLDILILDCPTRGVDVGVKAYIYALMRKMKEDGVSVILISDELTEVLGMSDRVAVMKDGRIAAILPRDVQLTESKVVEVML